MLFTFAYFAAFTLIAYLAFSGMFRSLRSLNRIQPKQPQAKVVPHPELLDRDGRPISEPLLVVNFVEPPDEVRRRLEEIYNKSQDAPER
ncbi:DUF2973 domain-containing protein [Anthocerotibacter panamensis]|uniref:DUF2973 domain-containing protein n=1 Tax=Anthocerotibacter panamensis TaxID=2857077 RepID=UPI001C4072CB|nr:DUF2973 domain-containing protein [Anthocerotibacter panamensis]